MDLAAHGVVGRWVFADGSLMEVQTLMASSLEVFGRAKELLKLIPNGFRLLLRRFRGCFGRDGLLDGVVV